MKDAACRPFIWGQWDCCLFALSHVDCITGSHHYSAFRNLCDDAGSAQAVLDGMGGLEQGLVSLFGPPLGAVLRAQRGDIVLYDIGRGPSMGVVALNGTHFCAISDQCAGLAQYRISRAQLAWRI